MNRVIGFADETLLGMLDDWVSDQRQREAWNDGDRATYRYRANLLEAAADRIRSPRRHG